MCQPVLVPAPVTTLCSDSPLTSGERPGRITSTQFLKRSLVFTYLPCTLVLVPGTYEYWYWYRTAYRYVQGSILRFFVFRKMISCIQQMLPSILHTPSILESVEDIPYSEYTRSGESVHFALPSPESISIAVLGAQVLRVLRV